MGSSVQLVGLVTYRRGVRACYGLLRKAVMTVASLLGASLIALGPVTAVCVSILPPKPLLTLVALAR